jgi:hypothetical protein
MEPPSRLDAHALRSEKAPALDAIHLPHDDSVLQDAARV